MSTTTTTETTTRLHITPLTPELLNSILPPSIRPSATDISFHSIPTFPENNYGYVTLPTMEADKIKKKLHGSILKGKKFKVEKANPAKRVRAESDGEEEKEEKLNPDKKRRSVSKTKEESKKRKSSDKDEILGYELPSDRHVKRGWTEPVSVKKERRKDEKMNNKKKGDKDADADAAAKKPKLQPKSKYTEKTECLFRTQVPPNKTSIGEVREDKKSKNKTRKGKSSEGTVVVHEFAATVTHPSFLRAGDEGKAPTTEFVDGKGWVDGSGNVKEGPSERIRRDEYRPGQKPGAKEKKKKRPVEEELVQAKSPKDAVSKGEVSPEESEESEDWTSSSGDSSSDESTSESDNDDDASSSSSDESSVSSHAEVNLLHQERKKKPATTTADITRQSTHETAITDSMETSDVSKEKEDNLRAAGEVHPLEALFKKPRNDTSQNEPAQDANTHFSFFGNDDLETDEEEDEPRTPFTRNDLQLRALRSAAPTPDTALISRKGYTWEDDNEEVTSSSGGEDEDVRDGLGASVNVQNATATTARSAAVTEKVPETDFAKWFWEHRGENNRAWKRRRREAAKEQRQRDNRRKGLKGKS